MLGGWRGSLGEDYRASRKFCSGYQHNSSRISANLEQTTPCEKRCRIRTFLALRPRARKGLNGPSLDSDPALNYTSMPEYIWSQAACSTVWFDTKIYQSLSMSQKNMALRGIADFSGIRNHLRQGWAPASRHSAD